MVTKVLMVCLGNICRSPLAEGILKSKVDPGRVMVDSAGTAGYHVGTAPDPRSVHIALKNGIDIRNQVCRALTPKDLEVFDYIYVMDKNNYADTVQLAGNKAQVAKIHFLLNEIGMEHGEVHDPYYGGADGFAKVYELIDRACDKIAEKLHKT